MWECRRGWSPSQPPARAGIPELLLGKAMGNPASQQVLETQECCGGWGNGVGEAEPQVGPNPLGGTAGSGVEEQQFLQGGEIPMGSRKVDFVNAFQSPRGIQPISGPRHPPPHWAVGCSRHSRIPTEQMILTGARSQPSPAPAAPARGWQGFCQCHCLFGAARLGFRCFWHDSAAGPCSLALHPSRCKSSQVGEGRQGMRTEPGMP